MNDAVKAMLKTFEPIRSSQDEDNALQEIIQRIVLLGLHRAGFFQKGAFYGGTALRILYGLDRFSEDLDFCLREPDPSFSLSPYFAAIEQELERFDFKATVSEKRTGEGVVIESAFVKQSTYQGLLVIGKQASRAQSGQLIKVRLEVDKLNPSGGEECEKLVQLPIPFLVKTLTLESLFAGKLHAIIARSYLNRVKGRDYYDLAYFLARDAGVNLKYLEAKLRDSGHYEGKSPLTRQRLIELLSEKFKTVDFQKAREDVIAFLKEPGLSAVREWSPELFIALVQNIRVG